MLLRALVLNCWDTLPVINKCRRKYHWTLTRTHYVDYSSIRYSWLRNWKSSGLTRHFMFLFMKGLVKFLELSFGHFWFFASTNLPNSDNLSSFWGSLSLSGSDSLCVSAFVSVSLSLYLPVSLSVTLCIVRFTSLFKRVWDLGYQAFLRIQNHCVFSSSHCVRRRELFVLVCVWQRGRATERERRERDREGRKERRKEEWSEIQQLHAQLHR